MDSFVIGDRKVGVDEPTFIIAEIGQTHEGSLGQAFAFIDALAKVGVDAVKFQTHYAEEESTKRDQWRVKFSKQDETRFDYWQRMEFTSEQWRLISNHCKEKEIIFLSSPFSNKAVDILESVDIPAWKVGSGEVDNSVLMEKMVKTGKPIIISTGMSTFEEIDGIYNKYKAEGVPIALLHCTSEYPVTGNSFGLNVIEEFRNRYTCPIGISSHMPNVSPCLASVVKGARIIEVHVTFTREMFGPDVCASLTIEEMKQMVEEVRLIEELINNPVDKDQMAQKLAGTRALFRKSIVAAEPLKAGTILNESHLAFKKPGDGLPVNEYNKFIGKKLVVNLNKDDILALNQIE